MRRSGDERHSKARGFSLPRLLRHPYHGALKRNPSEIPAATVSGPWCFGQFRLSFFRGRAGPPPLGDPLLFRLQRVMTFALCRLPPREEKSSHPRQKRGVNRGQAALEACPPFILIKLPGREINLSPISQPC